MNQTNDAVTRNQATRTQSQTGRYSIPWRLHLLVFSVGVLILFVMGYGFHLSDTMIARYAPLVDATMEIQLECTTAHLWFEEIVSGDRSEDIESVRWHLEQAEWYANAMLAGGQNPEGEFIALDDPGMKSQIEKVLTEIGRFSDITEKRYSVIQESGPGTAIDQRYDTVFRDLIDRVDHVETELQHKIAEESRLFKLIQSILVSVTFLLLCGIAFSYHRFERKLSRDASLLAESNADLHRAQREVRKLQGIIPICSYCKKIRDDEGSWNQLEVYIHEHSEAEFSHGMCPDCYQEVMRKLK